jgi:dihydrofolate synthase/folylpolyglutamate synthase
MNDNAADFDTTMPQGPFTSYADVLAHLDNLGLFHMELDLARIKRVLEELELTRPEYPVVQVVGTNGKGSTATFMASIATGAGFSTGLFISPHFITPRERVLVDGEMLPEEDWLVLANDIMAAGGEVLTYFEFLTVLAALAFADYEVDLAVFEAGLGGTYDATTAIAADTVVFTPVALDHQQILGDTVEKIAADKAGAIRSNVPVVSARQTDAVLEILKNASNTAGAPFTVAAGPDSLPEEARPVLNGVHQLHNAALAVAALQTVMDEKALPRPTLIPWSDVVTLGIADAWIAGRMQHIAPAPDHPALILDGGHNLHGLRALQAALAAENIRPAAIIFGAMKDKNLEGIPDLLSALTDGQVLLPALTQNSRAATPQELAVRLGGAPDGPTETIPCASVREALDKAAAYAAENPVLICGSLYLLADFFTLHPEYLRP